MIVDCSKYVRFHLQLMLVSTLTRQAVDVPSLDLRAPSSRKQKPTRDQNRRYSLGMRRTRHKHGARARFIYCSSCICRGLRVKPNVFYDRRRLSTERAACYQIHFRRTPRSKALNQVRVTTSSDHRIARDLPGLRHRRSNAATLHSRAALPPPRG